MALVQAMTLDPAQRQKRQRQLLACVSHVLTGAAHKEAETLAKNHEQRRHAEGA
jgi:hypothetical protein